MENFNPLVSIVIPVYNGANYMRQAIDSALAQTYKNTEIIVVNDGSKDNTEQIALSYGDKIRYFAKENGGQSSALNLGIEKMRGEYFSWLSHDDVYYPNKLEEQVRVLETLPNPSEAFIYSNYEIIDENSKHIRFVNPPQIPSVEFVYRMLVRIPVNGCTVLIHKSMLERVGLFTLDKPHTSDVELFLKLGLITQPYHFPRVLIQSRSHSQQATFRNKKRHYFESNQYGLEALKLVPKDILLASSRKSRIDKVYVELAKIWAKKGFYNASCVSINYYKKNNSQKIYPFYLKLLCFSLSSIKTIKRRLSYIIIKLK